MPTNSLDEKIDECSKLLARCIQFSEGIDDLDKILDLAESQNDEEKLSEIQSRLRDAIDRFKPERERLYLLVKELCDASKRDAEVEGRYVPTVFLAEFLEYPHTTLAELSIAELERYRVALNAPPTHTGDALKLRTCDLAGEAARIERIAKVLRATLKQIPSIKQAAQNAQMDYDSMEYAMRALKGNPDRYYPAIKPFEHALIKQGRAQFAWADSLKTVDRLTEFLIDACASGDIEFYTTPFDQLVTGEDVSNVPGCLNVVNDVIAAAIRLHKPVNRIAPATNEVSEETDPFRSSEWFDQHGIQGGTIRKAISDGKQIRKKKGNGSLNEYSVNDVIKLWKGKLTGWPPPVK